jgi:signal transduction histidine kinase
MEEHIFLPMQSGKRDLSGNTIGTGMGLAIVKNHIVDHVGGEVFAVAKSQLGGAEFLFKLPILRR